MKLFPDEVTIGTLASAQLVCVRGDPKTVVARFSLYPRDHNSYVDRMGGLGDSLGMTYRALPGTWVTFMVPEDRDEIELLIGLDRAYGQVMAQVHKRLGFQGTTLISEPVVRSLALGFLAKAGV